jgi:hypothetical protein
VLLGLVVPIAGQAESRISRAELMSGGGRALGSGVALRASLGESFMAAPGGGTVFLRPGVWLREPPVITAVDAELPIARRMSSLSQNVPNPFNPLTEISFFLVQPQTRARLAIYSISGRLIRTLVDGPLAAGRTDVIWDGTDLHERSVASGVYIYRLETSAFRAQRKLVLVR